MFEKFFHVNRRSVSRLAPCCLIPRFGPYFAGRRAYTALGNVIVHAMGQERWKPGQSIRIPEHSFLDQLRRFGSDTDRTHDMPFWLYFHGESGRQTWRGCRARGGGRGVRRERSGPPWLCLLYCPHIPDERILDSLNKFCSNQADECGGKFDGWETRLELPKGAGLKEGPWTR